MTKRGEIAKTIRFLKDNGAKTIAMDIAIDAPTTHLNPTWDSELANAITYAKNVVVFQTLNIIRTPEGNYDTVLTNKPIEIFDKALAGVGYANVEPIYDSENNPSGMVQYFYPNRDFKGEKATSFSLAVAMNYDSTKSKILGNKTEREYINFYQKKLFKIWDLSLLSDSSSNTFFKDFIKDKLIIFGFVNPEEDPLTSMMFTTPIGKVDFVLVYASIISDILKRKFVPESPVEVDLGVGALICLFNLIFISYASRRSLTWEKFTGGLLVLFEVFIVYFLVMGIYLFFEYKLSVITASITTFLSVPFISILNKKIIPLYNKSNAYSKFRKYPYPLIKPYIAALEPDKRSIRHMSLIFGFQKIFWFLGAVSYSAVQTVNEEEKFQTERECNKDFQNLPDSHNMENEEQEVDNLSPRGIEKIICFSDWNELKKFNLDYNKNEINKKVLDIINNLNS
jgi:CHASE2 domain-containing sensor protein